MQAITQKRKKLSNLVCSCIIKKLIVPKPTNLFLQVIKNTYYIVGIHDDIPQPLYPNFGIGVDEHWCMLEHTWHYHKPTTFVPTHPTSFVCPLCK